jgi:putative DNA methylase
MSVHARRKLIEVALPLEAINLASAREKSIRYGHPSTLHFWWARRPLAACRAVLFASLVDDPSSDPDRFPTPGAEDDERRRLFDIMERLVLWENTTNEAVLEEARAEILRSTGDNPPRVLDPFCGGGSIPLEAQRLGLIAQASDLNPVAVLITKAMIEIPPRFAGRPPVHPDARRGVGSTGSWKGAAGLAEDVRRYGAWMRSEAERRIGHLYPKVTLPIEQGGGEATVIAWLWARTVRCPNPACGAVMPLARTFVLSKMAGNEAWIAPLVDREARTVRFGVHTGSGTPPEPPKTGRGANFRCFVCGQVAPDEHIKSEGRADRIGAQLMAIVAEGQHGRTYLAPTDEQERIAASAKPSWGPEAELADDPRNLWCVQYGLRRFRDLFTSRQLVALVTLGDLVGEARDRVRRDAAAAGLPDDTAPATHGAPGAAEYALAVATYLGLATSRLADRNSTICTWDSGPAGTRSSTGSSARTSSIRSTFARQALPMTWDFAEASVFSNSSGGFDSAMDWVVPAIEKLLGGVPATARQADASSVSTPSASMLVSTDPPYYDNIGYADLSDFYYVWLRRSLGSAYPDLFATVLTPKTQEVVAAPYRFNGSKANAEHHFEQGLRAAFERIRSSAHPDYPVTVFYAFKQAESESSDAGQSIVSTGWETMLEALLRTGFSVEGTWPMRTERGARMIASGTNALASSIVLVCRPRHDSAGLTSRRDFVNSLKSELPSAIRLLQQSNIAPVDLAQASIGPGMAVFSRYAKVLEPDGSAMRVRTALSLINSALDELLTEQEGEFDADTRWAIAWYEQFGLKDGEFGTAETLSKAKNTTVSGLVDAGILAATRGRVRLLARSEYSAEWDPATDARLPVWEATQRLIRALLVDGETGASEVLLGIGGIGQVARDLAYRMYHVSERKGWTDEARAYNALVVAWTDIVRGAESARAAKPAQTSLGLG